MMWKNETGQKLGLVHQTAKLWMQRKSSRKKLKVLLQWIYQNSLTANMEKVLVSGLKIKPATDIPLILI